MIGLLLAASLALTPQASLSGSTDPQTEADFRCFAGSLVLAGLSADDDETAQAAAMLAFYYLGRLEGRAPGKDWVRIGVQLEDARADELIAELERCGAEFAAKSQHMIDTGKSGS